MLFAIRNNRVSAFQGELYIGSKGPIVGILENVRIIKVSTFQGCPQGGVPLYLLHSNESLCYHVSVGMTLTSIYKQTHKKCIHTALLLSASRHHYCLITLSIVKVSFHDSWKRKCCK